MDDNTGRQNYDDRWCTWDNDLDYGQTLYKRAVGELQEMESSKASARRVHAIKRDGDTILDVGCGVGHYLVSLRRKIGPDFNYTGADATENYVSLGRKAFAKDPKANFEVANIFDLPFANASFDIVICNNLLMHLPSIARPLEELVRVTRRVLIIRMLCGDRTFLIRDVRPGTPEIDENGTPVKFNYFNMYSQACVRHYLKNVDKIATINIESDSDFDAKNVNKSSQENDNRVNSTTMLGNLQVNGYIIMPWSFVTVTMKTAT